MPKKRTKKTLELWSLKYLALRLGIAIDELISVSENVEKLHWSWKEPKRNGEFRDLSDAAPRLKKIHKAIHRLLKGVDLGDSAYGGVPGRSHYSNATEHCRKRFIYKLDFKAYFPSISHYRVFHLFRHELKCSEDVASILTKLCTFQGQVPQGFGTSMDIANLVCCDLDARIRGLAKKFNLKYTRYVDDLTFSGDFFPYRFIQKVKNIIKSKSWVALNDAKEGLVGKGQAQLVTGLNVKRAKPRISRSYKRAVRYENFNLSRCEIEASSDFVMKKKLSSLKGKEAYIKIVEGA